MHKPKQFSQFQPSVFYEGTQPTPQPQTQTFLIIFTYLTRVNCLHPIHNFTNIHKGSQPIPQPQARTIFTFFIIFTWGTQPPHHLGSWMGQNGQWFQFGTPGPPKEKYPFICSVCRHRPQQIPNIDKSKIKYIQIRSFLGSLQTKLTKFLTKSYKMKK